MTWTLDYMNTNRRRVLTAALGATVLPAAGWALRGSSALAAAEPSASEPREMPRTVLLSPRGKDITTELETALAMLPQEIIVPMGEWLVSRTITLDSSQAGLTIRGPERLATLQWAGEGGGLMFLVRGSNQLRFEKLTLRGTGKKNGDTLVQLRYEKGKATSHMIMREVTLEKAGTGVLFGENQHDQTCSDCIFDFVKVHACDKGFWVRTPQGVNYFCRALYVYFTNVGWHLERGGLLLVDGAQIGWCRTFLRVDGGEINIGVAATLNNVKSEGVSKDRRFRLVEAVARGGCVVNVNGYGSTHSMDQEGITDFLIGAGNHVNVNGATFHRPPRIATLQGTAERPASLSMQGCLFFNGLDKKSFEVIGPRDVATLRECRSMTNFINRRVTSAGNKRLLEADDAS